MDDFVEEKIFTVTFEDSEAAIEVTFESLQPVETDTPVYHGSYVISPSAESQTIEISGMKATQDITVDGDENLDGSNILEDVTIFGTEGTIPRKSAETYIPGTDDQTIASGQYLEEAQTIQGDEWLQAEYIADGISIFGVDGSYKLSYTDENNDGNVVITGVIYTDYDGDGNLHAHTGYELKTVTGTDLTLEDASIGKNLKSLVAKLEPQQDGSGTPSSSNVRVITGSTEVGLQLYSMGGYFGFSYMNDGNPVYGGTYDLVTNTLTITYEVVDLATLEWTTFVEGLKRAYFPDWKRQSFSETNVNGIAERYYVTNAASPQVSDILVHYGEYIVIGGSGSPSGLFCYELAEPRVITGIPYLPVTVNALPVPIKSYDGTELSVTYLAFK